MIYNYLCLCSAKIEADKVYCCDALLGKDTSTNTVFYPHIDFALFTASLNDERQENFMEKHCNVRNVVLQKLKHVIMTNYLKPLAVFY